MQKTLTASVLLEKIKSGSTPPNKKGACVQQLTDELAAPGLPPGRRQAKMILNHAAFGQSMALIILFNLVVMIIETDRSTEPDGQSFHWTQAAGWGILGIFTMELGLRLYVFQCSFWTDTWNVFDFFIVAVDVIFSVLGSVTEGIFPVSVLRIFRLGKLARVSKLLRVFPELRLLVAGLVSSFSAILWGTVLLILSILVWAMVAVLFIHPLNKTLDYGESCERCPRAYSSVLHASLTFWQQIVTGDSWGQATIPLMETFPQTAIFFIALYLSIGLAVMNLILGVVVSIAQQAKDNMEEEDKRAQLVLREEQHTHLLAMCMELDKDGNGVITQNELAKVYEEPGGFREAFLSLDVTKEELDIIWKIIDIDQAGEVPYEDVVSAIYKMKGSDTNYMLAYIKHYITLVRDTIMTQMAENNREATKIAQKEREEIRQLQEVEALEFGVWQNIDSRLSQQLRCSTSDPKQVGAEVPQVESNTGVQATNLLNQARNVSIGHRLSLEKLNPDTKLSAKSVLTDDEVGIWLKQICHRISAMRVELQDIWTDMDGKAGPLASHESTLNESMTIMTRNSGSCSKGITL